MEPVPGSSMARLLMSWLVWLIRIPKETETEKVSERKRNNRKLRGILYSILCMQYNYEKKGGICQIIQLEKMTTVDSRS